MIYDSAYVMRTFSSLLALSLVALCWLPCISGKVAQGTLQTNANWAFVSRFCFVSGLGQLNYNVSYPTKYAVQNMYLYYDTADQWPAVYKSQKNCLQREAVLHRDQYQIVNLSTWSEDHQTPGCEIEVRDSGDWFRCMGFRRFLSARERWWYIAIGNCNATNEKGLYLEYQLHMTNGQPSDFWHYEFSADEFNILATDIGFLIVEFFTFAAGATIGIILLHRQLFHATYKIFLVALLLEVCSLLADCISMGVYAENGVGLPIVLLFGQMFRAASHIVFLMLILLVAKGYTITRGRLSRKGELKLTGFMSVYTIVYGAVFIYQAKFFDPGEVTYLYESVPGYILLVLRLIGWLWFCYAIYFTLVHYPEKRLFYCLFACFCTIWFWLGPVTVVMANNWIGKWLREKVVNGVENAICLLGFWAFLLLTMPCWARRLFPFHVRTAQIDALNDRDYSDRSVALPHHPYAAPEYNVFTVRSTSSASEISENGPNVALVETTMYMAKNDESQDDLITEQ